MFVAVFLQSLVFVAVFSSNTTESCKVVFSLFFLSSMIYNYRAYNTAMKTKAFAIRHFVVIVISLYFHILFSPVVAAPHNANRFKMSPLQEPESSILAPRKTQSCTISTFSPSNTNSSISSVDIALVFFRFR